MIRYWFYVLQDGMTVAKGDCPTKKQAEREAAHYAFMYSPDGDVQVKFRAVKSKD